MFNMLTPFGIPEISIITALSVAVIILITLNIVFIVRASRKKKAGQGEPVIVYVPVPASAGEPQPVVEEQPVEETAPAEQLVIKTTDITPEEEEILSRLKLDRSFTAKLVQTEEETKELYAELKRELLSYAGVHSRMSWRRETYSKSREALARFGVRGKTLCLYLALQPEEFTDSKYKAEDASNHSSYTDTPLMYRIKNPLRMRYAKELIGILMSGRGLEKGEYVGEDPIEGLEYRNTPTLIEEGLIRVPAGMELPVFTEPAQESQPVVEEQPVEEIAPTEQLVINTTDITPEEEEILSRLKLDRSFTAKLVQTEEETKELYAELKRELLSYAGVHSRMSWRRETYSKSREALARFGVRGKTLCLYLALQPEEFTDSKYKAEDASNHSSYTDTPLMYRIKNPLRMRYAKELIGILMSGRGLEKGEYAGEDPLEGLEYRNTPTLIEEGLIRVPAGMELPVFTEPVQEEQPVVEEQPTEELQPEVEEIEEETFTEPIEEVAEEVITEPVQEEQPVVEEQPTEELQPEVEEIEEETFTEPIEEVAEEVITEPVAESAGEVAIAEEVEEPEPQPVEEQPVVEEQPTVQPQPEVVEEIEKEPEHCIPVVGVVFRRRTNKIYWFDQDGKEWKKDEVAIFTTPEGVRTEVIVVEVTERAESLLHLPLKPLEKSNL